MAIASTNLPRIKHQLSRLAAPLPRTKIVNRKSYFVNPKSYLVNLKSHIFLLSIAFCLLATSLNAQDYPVQITTTLTPPYSLYLADYASPDRPALQVIVNLRELDRPEYKVKLRVTIEGQGITLRTKSGYIPAPLILQGGLPEVLTGDEISHYLNPDNLDFSGISRKDFMKRGTFPEGFYTFKIEAIDYNRGIVVSNAGLANAWIILNDPPLINLPFNNDKIVATDPQNVLFSWTPRHTASPNAAFSTEYEFKLVELYPANRNPNDAILSSNSIYVTTTNSTSLNYGVADPLLIPGRRYAFRVRAYDTDGRDLFKNNGYSEVYVFQFGDACVPPVNLKGEVLDDTRIKLLWEPADPHTSFDFQYKNEDRTDWWQQNTLSDFAIIPGLKPATTYQYQVRGRCGTVLGDFTPVAIITTKDKKEDAFVCGADVPPFEIKTTPLKGSLHIGDEIKTADFEITLLEVIKNSNDTYKGTGFARMPWLNMAAARVKFRAIRVNEDYRVYEGNVTTIYSKDSRFVVNIDAVKEELKETYKGNQQLQQLTASVQIAFPAEIKTITIDATTGNIVITKEDGTTETIERPKDSAGNIKDAKITDSNGDSWVVGKDGTIQQGPSTAAPAVVTSMDAVNFNVTFVPNPQQNYGFDAKDEKLKADYESIQIKGQDYTIPWKAVESGRQELVNMQAAGKSTFPTSVGFKTINGPVPSQAASESGQKQAFLTGGLANQTEAVTAYVKVKEPDKDEQEVIVGRLNVATYDKILNKLYIVPVNDATAPGVVELNEELNKIYWQAVAGWDVSIDDRFNVDPNILPALAAGMSGMLSPFPPNMLSFNHLFINDPTRFIDNDAYYIFLVNGVNTDKQGFMPFKRKFGYIFLNNATNVINAIAHELGHGAFRLKHTFNTEDFRASESTTDNLMDYNGGTNLKKYQWDGIRKKEALISWLMDDSESALLADKINVDLQNGGIEITYRGITGTLQSFGFNIKKEELKFKVLQTKANPPIGLGTIQTIQNELDALFQRAAGKLNRQLSSLEFLTKAELEKVVWSKQDEIKKYLEDLIHEIEQSGLEDLAGLSEAESTALKNSIKKFKDQQGIDPSVTVVDETLFNLLKSKYQAGERQPSKDVHLIVDKTGQHYSFIYKDGFFTIPTQKTIEGTGEVVQLTGTTSEIFAIRDQVISTAITNDDIQGIGKINEPTLNIFEKGMWVIKVTKETLAQVKVPVPMWDQSQKGTYPFNLESTVAGIGDGVIDEFKSIPDLLLMGLSLFDKQEWDALMNAISSINLQTLQSMFEEKISKYTQGGDVAAHEGGYDAVQVASIFWGGAFTKGKKASAKADDILGVLKNLSQDVKDKLAQLTAKQRDDILRDLGSSSELLQKMTPELVDAWKVIEANPILRKRPENLKNISKWLDEGIEPQKLTDGIANSSSKQNLIDELGNAKSTVHAQVLIKDYDNIPGVVKGRYVTNSSTVNDKVKLPDGWATDVDLPDLNLNTFTGKIEPFELKPGDKIYRVSPYGKQDGAYWTTTKPEKLDHVIGGTAVEPEWNNFEYIHEYTVPEGVTIKSWKGKTARQPVSDATPSNYHLPGGDEQLYIKYIAHQDPSFASNLKSIKASW